VLRRGVEESCERDRRVCLGSIVSAVSRNCGCCPPRSAICEGYAEAQETTHVATKAEEVGRTSGDASWRAQRGELGANDAAKKKALECSETGLEQAGTSLPSTGYEGAQDAQAALRARVAKLMATGLSANDALLKVLEEAKQKAC